MHPLVAAAERAGSGLVEFYWFPDELRDLSHSDLPDPRLGAFSERAFWEIASMTSRPRNYGDSALIKDSSRDRNSKESSNRVALYRIGVSSHCVGALNRLAAAKPR